MVHDAHVQILQRVFGPLYLQCVDQTCKVQLLDSISCFLQILHKTAHLILNGSALFAGPATVQIQHHFGLKLARKEHQTADCVQQKFALMVQLGDYPRQRFFKLIQRTADLSKQRSFRPGLVLLIQQASVILNQNRQHRVFNFQAGLFGLPGRSYFDLILSFDDVIGLVEEFAQLCKIGILLSELLFEVFFNDRLGSNHIAVSLSQNGRN